MARSDPLDLPRSTGQRSSSFRWRLLDSVTGRVRGQLTPIRDFPPRLSHDTDSTISRRITGVVLGVQDAGVIQPLRDRLEVSMVLSTGRGEREYPLGRYVVADASRLETSGGATSPITFLDEMFLVDQELDSGFSAGDRPVDEVILRLVSGLPVGEVEIDATDQTAATSYSAGTSRASALNDLALLGGYLRPWFDHVGRLRLRRVFEPANRVPDIDLDASPRVVAGSVARSNDLLTTPNRIVVISNDLGVETQTAPVVGVYDVPASAPHSIAQRGLVVPMVVDAQVTTVQQARTYARSLGIRQTGYETVHLTTPADPRHDGYDVVRWDGQMWLETAWSMTLESGGPMWHTLRRAYGLTDGEGL